MPLKVAPPAIVVADLDEVGHSANEVVTLTTALAPSAIGFKPESPPVFISNCSLRM